MSKPITINIDPKTFLGIYRPLIMSDEVFDIDFLYGGRDSGKSRHIAMQLVIECLKNKYFRCLVIRKVLDTIRGSQYALIKDVIEEWKLTEYFSFNGSLLEIHCKLNGNAFFCKGLDDVAKIKSFSNPSCCWIEEGNQITAEDFVVVLTSLRSNHGKVKTWFSFNPECEMSYTDFWLWQDWFSHTEQLSFTHTRHIETPKGIIEFKVRATHGTYLNNRFCDAQRMALYESYKNSKNNAYWYQTYTLGLWGYKRPGGTFYKCFDEDKHTLDFNKIIGLRQRRWTYHIVADNNVNPYVTIAIWMVDKKGKALLQVDEIPCVHPDNTATKAALKVVEYLRLHEYNDKVFIYGDPSANARSTVDDEGRSFFDKFIGVLRANHFDYVNRVGRSAPSVSQSGSFVNEIFERNYDGWKILINKTCRKSIEDYNMTVEDIDGGILKKKVKNKDTGVSYEKYGHFSDNLRYIVSTVLKEEYETYLTRRKGIPRAGGLAVVPRTSRMTP
jgi:phage terminase large subunit